MARIRYLKPGFFLDEDLKELSFEARLFYAGLWCMADKAGRLEDRPERLKVEIMPYDDINPEEILQRLTKPKKSGRPFILRYEIDGEKYIQIISWEKHQKPHNTEAESRIPAPPFNPPKKERGMGMGKGNAKPKSTSRPPLDNGSLTVKQPLDNRYEEEFPPIPKHLPFKVKDKLSEIRAAYREGLRLQEDPKQRQHQGFSEKELTSKMTRLKKEYLTLLGDYSIEGSK